MHRPVRVDRVTGGSGALRIGLYISTDGATSLDLLLDRFAAADRLGFATAWIGHTIEHDSLTLLALAGRATRRIELGSWVVPIAPRHPVALAQAARTTQAACAGRFTLGIGVSHRAVVAKRLGLPYDRPRSRMEALLDVLPDLLAGERVERRDGDAPLSVRLDGPPIPPTPIFLAALGPRMLELAGARAQGVAIWLGGRSFVDDYARAHVEAGARAAGRECPRIAVGLPIAVTRSAAARSSIDRFLGPSVRLPAYREVLERQGASSAGEIAIHGDESQVDRALDALAEAGVSDFNAILAPVEDDPDALARTRDFLAERAARSVRASQADLA